MRVFTIRLEDEEARVEVVVVGSADIEGVVVVVVVVVVAGELEIAPRASAGTDEAVAGMGTTP